MSDSEPGASDDGQGNGQPWYEWLGCFVNGCALFTGGSAAALGLMIWWGANNWLVI